MKALPATTHQLLLNCSPTTGNDRIDIPFGVADGYIITCGFIRKDLSENLERPSGREAAV
jgi:hypothetical protein